MNVISKELKERLLYAVWDVKAINWLDLKLAIAEIIRACETEDEFDEAIEELWELLTNDSKADLLVASEDGDWYMSYWQELLDFIDTTFCPVENGLEALKKMVSGAEDV